MLFKYRAVVWASALVAALCAVGINALSIFALGIDLSSVILVVLIPVGLMVLGAVVAGGFVLAAKWTRLEVNVVDLVFLMLLCASIVYMIYGWEYLSFAHPDRQAFSDFVVSRVTKARYLTKARGMLPEGPTLPIGEAGWALLLVKTGCMLAIARVGYSMAKPAGSTWTA